MVKNFSNLVREIDTQIQEAQSTKQDEPKEAHTKIKYKDRILKAARKKKKAVTYKGAPYDYQLISQKKFCSLEEVSKKYSKS